MKGWVLVPQVPTERMLTEFSGVWAQWLPRDRRKLELEAYANMLAVVPTPPCENAEVMALREQVRRLKTTLNQKTKQCDKAYDKIRAMHLQIEALTDDRKDTA